MREARRAGEMLKRMRDYISNRETSPVFTPVARIVDDVAGLVKTDLDRRGIALVLENARRTPAFSPIPSRWSSAAQSHPQRRRQPRRHGT